MPSFALGRILGFPIKVNLSFLLLLALTVLWAGGVAGLQLVFVAFSSVLLHELGHAVVARRLGVRIKEIELHFFGGAAKMLGMPQSPRHEMAIAAAGPAVSLVLGGSLYLAFALTGWQPLFWPALINFGIAIFNLLPALPMDGGRILRAGLTSRMGHLGATELSVTISRGLAVSLGLIGLGMGYFQLAAIAVLIWLMASAELRMARAQHAHRSPFDVFGAWMKAWSHGPPRPPHRGAEKESLEVEYLPPARSPRVAGRMADSPRPKAGPRVVIYRT